MIRFFSSKSFWITFIVFLLLYSLNVKVNDLAIGSMIKAFILSTLFALISAIIIGGIIYGILHALSKKNRYK